MMENRAARAGKIFSECTNREKRDKEYNKVKMAMNQCTYDPWQLKRKI